MSTQKGSYLRNNNKDKRNNSNTNNNQGRLNKSSREENLVTPKGIYDSKMDSNNFHITHSMNDGKGREEVIDSREVSKDTATKDTTAKDTAAKDTVTNDTATKDTATKDTAARDTAAKDTATKDTATKNTTAKDTAAKDTVTKDTATKDTATNDTTAKDTAAKDTVTKDTATKDTAAKDTVTKDTAAKDTATKDTTTKDTTTKDTAAKDMTTNDTATKDTAAKDTVTNDTATKNTATKDTATKDTTTNDTATKDTAAKDTATKDTAARDTVTKDTSAKDTATKDTVTVVPLQSPIVAEVIKSVQNISAQSPQTQQTDTKVGLLSAAKLLPTDPKNVEGSAHSSLVLPSSLPSNQSKNKESSPNAVINAGDNNNNDNKRGKGVDKREEVRNQTYISPVTAGSSSPPAAASWDESRGREKPTFGELFSLFLKNLETYREKSVGVDMGMKTVVYTLRLIAAWSQAEGDVQKMCNQMVSNLTDCRMMANQWKYLSTGSCCVKLCLQPMPKNPSGTSTTLSSSTNATGINGGNGRSSGKEVMKTPPLSTPLSARESSSSSSVDDGFFSGNSAIGKCLLVEREREEAAALGEGEDEEEQRISVDSSLEIRFFSILTLFFRSFEQLNGDFGFWGKFWFYKGEKRWNMRNISYRYKYFKSLALTCGAITDLLKFVVYRRQIRSLRRTKARLLNDLTCHCDSCSRGDNKAKTEGCLNGINVVEKELRKKKIESFLLFIRNLGDMFIYYQWRESWKPAKTLVALFGMYSGIIGVYLIWNSGAKSYYNETSKEQKTIKR